MGVPVRFCPAPWQGVWGVHVGGARARGICIAAELLANAHSRGLKVLLRHVAEADGEPGACGLLQAPAAFAWEGNDIV